MRIKRSFHDADDFNNLVLKKGDDGYLVRLGENRHVFVFTAHHIICDGWSLNVIINELSAEERQLFDPTYQGSIEQRV